MITFKQVEPVAAQIAISFLDTFKIRYTENETEDHLFNITIKDQPLLLVGDNFVGILSGKHICYLNISDFYKLEVI